MAELSRNVFSASTPFVLGIRTGVYHNPCMDEFAQKLAKFRRLRQLTQTQLAEKCGYPTQSRIGNYESGQRTPRLDEIPNLAKQLGCAPIDLLPDSWQSTDLITQRAASMQVTAEMMRAAIATTQDAGTLLQMADALDSAAATIQPRRAGPKRLADPNRPHK